MTHALLGKSALILGEDSPLVRDAAALLAARGASVRVAADLSDDGVRPDVLVYCVAEIGLDALADEDAMTRLAAASCWRTVRTVCDDMARSGRGSVIAAWRASPTDARLENPARVAARAAIGQLVRAMGLGWGSRGVRVNALSYSGGALEGALTFLASDSSAHVSGAIISTGLGWSSIDRLNDRPGAATVSPHRGPNPTGEPTS